MAKHWTQTRAGKKLLREKVSAAWARKRAAAKNGAVLPDTAGDYAAVLATLQTKRDQLDAAIAAVEVLCSGA